MAGVQPSNSGIITDDRGQRQIPESTRPDGSTRKAIKIRPGYRPPEDVELYKNRTAETFRTRGKGGILGAEGLKEEKADQASAASSASNKNAKRREARKKAKAAESQKDDDDNGEAVASAAAPELAANAEEAKPAEEAIPEIDKDKKVRNLKKKLKQARDLKEKKEGGEPLLPEQIAKVIKISELIRELQALGFDADGEPKKGEDEGEKEEKAAS